MKACIYKTSILLLLLFFSVQSFLGSDLNKSRKEQEELQHEVKVTLKLIQIYVSDKKGNPVMDLEKDEFTLYDNGKIQKIIGFEKHFLALPVKEKTAMPEEEKKPEQEQDIFPQMHRKFFFLFDAIRNTPYNINKSKTAALHFLDTQLKPTDEVAVLSFHRVKFLVLHQYLTTDHEKVRKVIKELKLLTEVPKGMPLNPSRAVPMPSGKEHLLIPSYTENQAKANICTNQLRELAKSLRSIPGNKSIIYFSQGFNRSLLFAPDQTLREKYQDTGKELGSSSTAVYSVNTRGGGGEESLKMISRLSGGKYFENVEYYQEIARKINKTTGNYYVLGFYIDDKWDGAFHEINVKVKRKDCTVRSQSGYFNPKPFSELSEFEKKLQLLDLALNEHPYHQVPVEIPTLALTFPGDKQTTLVLLSKLPLDTLGEVTLNQIELAAFVIDEQKSIIDSRMGELTLHDMDKETIFHYIISSVPDGNYENCIVIRNLKTGKAAVARSSIEISPEPEAGLLLYPPLLLEPEKQALYIHTLKREKDEKTEQSPSIKDIYPFLASSVCPLIDRIEKGTPRILAVMVNSIRGIENPDIRLTAEVINQSTKEKILLDSQIISVENKGTADILLLELELPELESGEYSIEFTALENTTGKICQQKTGIFLLY